MTPQLRRLAPILALVLGLLVPAPIAAAEPAGFEYFHTYAENNALIDAAVADHSAIARRVTIGQSYEGRDIHAIKISDNVATDEGEPEVLFVGLAHARERASHEMALYLIERLTNEYDTNTRVRDIVDSREIWIIPMLNPDGAEFDFSGGVFHTWRKNRQLIPGSTKIGIDLNRNSSYKWGGAGSSGNPGSKNYRGWAPEVAPEIIAYHDFIDSRVRDGRQQIRASINYHSAGRQVLWPYAYTRTDVPPDMTHDDWLAFVALGEQMAAMNNYTAEQGSDLYLVSGDADDKSYFVHRIFGYTFEMAKGSANRYYPSQAELDADLQRNWGPALHLLEMADCPHRAAGLGATHCGPLNDDFEAPRGWRVDADGTDTATAGIWHRGVPVKTKTGFGVKQRAVPVSGMNDLVTGRKGGKASRWDVDGGLTSIESPEFSLGGSSSTGWTLDFWYTFAHGASAASNDFFRVRVGNDVVFSQEGVAANRNAAWTHVTLSLDAYAGQTVRIVFEAADGGPDTIVEAAVDDVRVYRQ